MNLRIRMTDMNSGEILYNVEKTLACQFHCRDVGFNLLDRVVRSCVRGARGCGDRNKVRDIELNIKFSEGLFGNSLELPFQDGKSF